MLSKSQYFLAGPSWSEKWIQHRRKVKQVINAEQIGRSRKTTKFRPGLAGHQRHPDQLSWHILNYRTITWWRERQNTSDQATQCGGMKAGATINTGKAKCTNAPNSPTMTTFGKITMRQREFLHSTGGALPLTETFGQA